MSFAEVKAISSGNLLILEKSKADQELARLERLNRAWHRNQSSLVFRKDAAQARGDALEQELGLPHYPVTFNLDVPYGGHSQGPEAWPCSRWSANGRRVQGWLVPDGKIRYPNLR
ncbi:hypothetical protein [Kocuria nitroreducens]|uniref:hypothetical protein n=1 Tax=Kocuria nitroreducens TaxID=3058914 RepID=UPI0036DED534